jgi:hypothetical protein
MNFEPYAGHGGGQHEGKYDNTRSDVELLNAKAKKSKAKILFRALAVKYAAELP